MVVKYELFDPITSVSDAFIDAAFSGDGGRISFFTDPGATPHKFQDLNTYAEIYYKIFSALFVHWERSRLLPIQYRLEDSNQVIIFSPKKLPIRLRISY